MTNQEWKERMITMILCLRKHARIKKAMDVAHKPKEAIKYASEEIR